VQQQQPQVWWEDETQASELQHLLLPTSLVVLLFWLA
jgi:hypothetical protein